MNKDSILTLGFLVTTFSWITWAVTFVDINSTYLSWTFYVLPLLLALIFNYFGKENYAFITSTLPTLTVVCELIWAQYWGGFTEEDMFGEKRLHLIFNGLGRPGVILLTVVIPSFFALVNMLIVNKVKKPEEKRELLKK